ncbi:MAG TPA: hypothetical protein EYP10_05435 [Armatimonadetes bacterium]|nr:hypothetical protein [Armatimonadota bacterium]
MGVTLLYQPAHITVIGSIALNDDEISTIATKQRNALKAFRKLMGELREQMQKKSTAELIDCIVKQTGYDEFLRTEGDLIAQERLDNIRQLMISAQRQFGDAPATQTLHAFLEQLALVTGQDAATWDDDAVTLLTVHSAKGLEFPVVFVVGLEEGLFPHARSMNDERELEEERRLFYVALTRAKDRIFLVRAIRRMTISASGYYQASQFPSRFIDEIPEELKEQIYGQPTLTGFVRSFTVSTEMAKPAVTGIDLKTVLSPSSVGSTLATESQDAFHTSTVARNETAQMKVQFQPGDRVRHDQFGLGTVKSVEPRGKYWHAYVVFDNPDVGEKCLALEYAPMEKVTEE